MNGMKNHPATKGPDDEPSLAAEHTWLQGIHVGTWVLHGVREAFMDATRPPNQPN